MKVDKKDFGDTWAFTVDSGEILNINSAIIFKHNDTEYALNGIASSRKYVPIDPIWKKDPNNTELRICITPFIEIGNKL